MEVAADSVTPVTLRATYGEGGALRFFVSALPGVGRLHQVESTGYINFLVMGCMIDSRNEGLENVPYEKWKHPVDSSTRRRPTA